MSEKKHFSGRMRMAKADQSDMDAAYRIMNLLDSMSRGYYPSNEEGSPTFFDSEDREHLQFLHQQIIEIAENSAGVSRVIGAAGILLNPQNNLIDPDDDCIELHPDLKMGNTAAAQDVLAERRRQVVAEGWTPEHDDQHRLGELAMAAASYACAADDGDCEAPRAIWPWDWSCWNPKDRRHNLIKAGALILAEIERLDRIESPKSGD